MNAFDTGFSWIQFGLGLLLAALVAAAAYKLHSLSRTGAWAAVGLGTVIFGLGGLPWAALLLTFFVSSSLLSRLFKRQKASVDEKFSKGSTRDASQVLANGGIAGAAVILQAIWPAEPWLWVAGAAALAAANADTWATELGVLSPIAPRLITSGVKVEKGTSGGVSLLGFLSALSGAAAVAAVALLVWPEYAGSPFAGAGARLALISLAGLAGSLVDSLLGATVQAIYYCPTCRKETERYPLHTCGTPTTRAHGWPWLDNDWVNTACTASAALLGGLAAGLLAAPLALQPAAAPAANGMTLSAPAFAYGAVIPDEYTCQGTDQSPALEWAHAPAAATGFALIVTDPDAPLGPFTHWVIYNLPADLNSLPAGIQPGSPVAGSGLQGKNDFFNAGYGGPCPPAGGPHRYYFTLYALDLPADLPAGLNARALQDAMQGHILAQTDWMGTYQR